MCVCVLCAVCVATDRIVPVEMVCLFIFAGVSQHGSKGHAQRVAVRMAEEDGRWADLGAVILVEDDKRTLFNLSSFQHDFIFKIASSPVEVLRVLVQQEFQHGCRQTERSIAGCCW